MRLIGTCTVTKPSALGSENLLIREQITQTVNQSTERLPEEVKALVMLRDIEEKVTP